MSNLIKSGVVAINSKEKRVIDSDSRFDRGFRPLVFEKVEEIEAFPEELEEEAVTEEEPDAEDGGLTQEQTDLLFHADSDEAAIQMLLNRQAGKESGSGNNNNKNKKKKASPAPAPKKEKKKEEPLSFQKQSEQQLKEAKEEAERIIAGAKAQAEEMINRAQEEARKLTENASQQGYEEGYQQAIAQAQEELDSAKQELEQEVQRINEDYEAQISNLEPQVIELICDLIKKLTGVVLSERKDIVAHIVACCMEGIERSQVYLIHVSKEDFHDLSEQKPKLEKLVPAASEIRIVEDNSLKKNQCLIESDTAIYDSSLDLQLERLCEDLRILSLDVE